MRLYSGSAAAISPMPASPTPTPGANSSTQTVVQHIPSPSSRVPATPTHTAAAVPLRVTCRSSRRSRSSGVSAGGRERAPVRRISACSWAE